MGDEVGRPPLERIAWCVVDLASRLLHPEEREAVRGDLTETRARGGPALREVLGLVARRQAALWMDWRPWLALVGVVVPLGMLLSHVSRLWADGNALDASLYVRLWDWAYLGNPGWRRDLVSIIAATLTNYLALIGWSWTSGFVLGSLSRRTRWVTATLFCLVVLLGTVGSTTTARAYNAMVFSGPFHGVVLLRLVRTVCVLLPALWGMHWSATRSRLPLLQAIVGAVAIVILTAWAARGLEGSLVFGRVGRPVTMPESGPDGFIGTADDPRPLWPLSLVMLWPAAYIVGTSSWHRCRGSSNRRAGLA